MSKSGQLSERRAYLANDEVLEYVIEVPVAEFMGEYGYHLVIRTTGLLTLRQLVALLLVTSIVTLKPGSYQCTATVCRVKYSSIHLIHPSFLLPPPSL